MATKLNATIDIISPFPGFSIENSHN